MSHLRTVIHLAGVGLVVLFASALYLPFLGNPLVFDDRVFFSGQHFAYYATHPLGLEPRATAYFTLASVEVIWGTIGAHRIVSLALHLACALALYRLSYQLLLVTQGAGRAVADPMSEERAASWALVGGALFALHPVAVYGAAYLVQRTAVLGTLFALLSLLALLHALRRDRVGQALLAALLYSLAVMSKEHMVLLPLVALPLAALVAGHWRSPGRPLAVYVLACVPAAIHVLLLRRTLIGQAYEPDIAAVTAQIGGATDVAVVDPSWTLSVVTQAGLFFRYLAAWLWPDTAGMSIDVRIDPLATWSPAWVLLKGGGFALCAMVAYLLLRRGGRAALAGFGLAYVWLLFLVEMGAMRFQEIFVLYRSYLWAPGIVLIVVALLCNLRMRFALAVLALTLPVLAYQSHDRLRTFSNPVLLWEDAVAKLPVTPVPYGSRTLYNLGREYLYSEQPQRAIEVTERCMAEYPGAAHCVTARGAIHLQLDQPELALPYLQRAAAMRPQDGVAQHRLGMAFESLGDIERAKAHYRRAIALGDGGGAHQLARIESPGSGLLPPLTTPPARR